MMKLVLICAVVCLAVVKLNAAAIGTGSEHGETIDKKEALASKLESLLTSSLKSMKSVETKRGNGEVEAAAASGDDRKSRANILMQRLSSSLGKSMQGKRGAATLKDRRGRQKISGVRKEQSRNVGQTLRRRLAGARNVQTRGNAMRDQQRRGLKTSRQQQRRSRFLSSASSKTLSHQAARTAQTGKTRTSSQAANKRQYMMNDYPYMSCEYCFEVMNYRYMDSTTDYDDCYNEHGYMYGTDAYNYCNYGYDSNYISCEYCYDVMNYYGYDDPDYDTCMTQYGYMDTGDVYMYCPDSMYYPDDPTLYGGDPTMYGGDPAMYPGGESPGGYNTSCDVPCMMEYGDSFFMCFLSEIYESINELQDYMFVTPERFDELECRIWNVLHEVTTKTQYEVDNADPYATDYYYYYKKK